MLCSKSNQTSDHVITLKGIKHYLLTDLLVLCNVITAKSNTKDVLQSGSRALCHF